MLYEPLHHLPTSLYAPRTNMSRMQHVSYATCLVCTMSRICTSNVCVRWSRKLCLVSTSLACIPTCLVSRANKPTTSQLRHLGSNMCHTSHLRILATYACGILATYMCHTSQRTHRRISGLDMGMLVRKRMGLLVRKRSSCFLTANEPLCLVSGGSLL